MHFKWCVLQPGVYQMVHFFFRRTVCWGQMDGFLIQIKNLPHNIHSLLSGRGFHRSSTKETWVGSQECRLQKMPVKYLTEGQERGRQNSGFCLTKTLQDLFLSEPSEHTLISSVWMEQQSDCSSSANNFHLQITLEELKWYFGVIAYIRKEDRT